MRNIIITIFFIYISFVPMAHADPTAKITYKIVEESGEPIEGVEVRAGFRTYYKGVPQISVDEGVTDDEGLCSVSGSTEYEVTVSFYKDGYYVSGNTFGGGQFTGVAGIMGFRRWKPWNPTVTVVLKSIKQPTALYMRKLGSTTTYKGVKDDPSSFITKTNEYIGFDLIESDWVLPYGKGTTADLEFKLTKDIRSIVDYDYKLYIKFPNEGDGIQSYITPKDNSSIFKTLYHAPTSGYVNEYVISKSSNYQISDKDKQNQNYFIRVRTQRDEKGNIISAMYGKIEGNLIIRAASLDELGRLEFQYFLNPVPNDTNLEFDESKNLFGDKFKVK